MKFDSYFRLTSYATIAAAALALFVSGGIAGWLAIAFALLMILSWKLEGTRRQLTERVALIVILVSLPLFYLDWRVMGTYLDISFLEGAARERGSVEVA